jgi:hypothetical protein
LIGSATTTNHPSWIFGRHSARESESSRSAEPSRPTEFDNYIREGGKFSFAEPHHLSVPKNSLREPLFVFRHQSAISDFPKSDSFSRDLQITAVEQDNVEILLIVTSLTLKRYRAYLGAMHAGSEISNVQIRAPLQGSTWASAHLATREDWRHCTRPTAERSGVT